MIKKVGVDSWDMIMVGFTFTSQDKGIKPGQDEEERDKKYERSGLE